jgi:N-acetylglucosamine kinase-like BadF-type ATPase
MKRALAVDGGNSKTDVAVLSAEGDVLGFARGPASSPHHIGVEGTVEIVAGLIEEALGRPADGQVADVAALLMAGVDFPGEEDELRGAVAARGWVEQIFVGNDTFAVLRAGTERGWGVAVVCGAGINCVGVAPDGRHARFPALGPITGDWGGGFDVGLAATSAAARSEDGRGPTTSLERLVPAQFGVGTPLELAEEIHRGAIPMGRLEELPPVVFAAAADDDAVAAQIVDRLASEVVALSRVALERLDLTEQPVEVLLGGGLLQAGDGRLLDRIEAGMREVGPEIAVRRSSSPPIVGAVLLALDSLGASLEAQARAREQVGQAAGGAERLPVG